MPTTTRELDERAGPTIILAPHGRVGVRHTNKARAAQDCGPAGDQANMGNNDNRKSLKMRRRAGQNKLKARMKRAAEAARASRRAR
jgi:hypothetical protein